MVSPKKPHKHAEFIHAFANGETLQFRSDPSSIVWYDICQEDYPGFHNEYEYRVKPEPKPDYWYFCAANRHGVGFYSTEQMRTDNLKLTFDGETGKLKAAEVIDN